MTIAGWIIWGLLCFFSAAWSFGIYGGFKKSKWFPNQLETVAVWWLALGWALLTEVSKLHLLWIAPAAVLGPLFAWMLAVGRLKRPTLRLGIWVLVFAAVLGLLTHRNGPDTNEVFSDAEKDSLEWQLAAVNDYQCGAPRVSTVEAIDAHLELLSRKYKEDRCTIGDTLSQDE